MLQKTKQKIWTCLLFNCNKLLDFCFYSGQSNASVLLLLEGLHTVVSSLPQRVHTNSHFTKFLWQKLCPVLIGLMTPPRNTNITFTRLLPMDSLPQHKIIYRYVSLILAFHPAILNVKFFNV